MNIIVAAQACRTSGALTIYTQFICHLKEFRNDYNWIIFIDSSMPQPDIKGVKYVIDDNHSWKKRILWNRKGCIEWCETNRINPNCIVSLQNTGVITDVPQVIYYHQPLPFYSKSWNPLKRSERIMWAYKHIYPYFVKESLNENTKIVVQIPFIKEGFCKRFNFEKNKVIVQFPDIDLPHIHNVNFWNDEYAHFLYPATSNTYKKHITIAKALLQLKFQNFKLSKKIKVHFTISQEETIQLIGKNTFNKIYDMIICEGKIPFENLLKMYGSANGLLFPSIIETLGMPLIEAAHCGLPIIANDLPYAREVLNKYDGVKFLSDEDIDGWSFAMEELSKKNMKFPPLKQDKSQWPEFFDIINQLVQKTDKNVRI